MARICIECKKEVTDDQECYLIKDDFFTNMVRFVRTKLRIVKNNVLCVHRECAEKSYFSKVKKFKRKIFVAILVAVGIVFLVSLLQLWAGVFTLQGFVFLLVLAFFVFLLFVLGSDSYAPAFYPHLFKGKDLPTNYNELAPIINKLELEEARVKEKESKVDVKEEKGEHKHQHHRVHKSASMETSNKSARTSSARSNSKNKKGTSQRKSTRQSQKKHKKPRKTSKKSNSK